MQTAASKDTQLPTMRSEKASAAIETLSARHNYSPSPPNNILILRQHLLSPHRRQHLPPHRIHLRLIKPPSLSPPFLHLLLFLPILPLAVRTAAVVKGPDLAAVEQLLAQPLVDLVVHVASPHGRRASAAHLRRKFLQQLAEMRGAFAARIQLLEQVDVGPEGLALLRRRLVGEACKCRVEDAPRCAAELGSVGVCQLLLAEGPEDELWCRT